MKYILGILFSILYLPGFSQSFTILDSQSKEPVPFATVLFFNEGKTVASYYADENGMLKPDLKTFDKVKISCIGYSEKSVAIGPLFNDPIYLERISYQLDEVVVSANAKINELGEAERKGKTVTAASMGAEAVLFIDNPDLTEKAVKSFLFKANTPKGYKTAFRIHFYKKDPVTGAPGEEMPHRDIIKYIPPGKSMRKIEVDLTAYGIILPAEGMFAGIEWLSCINAEGKVLGAKDYEGWYKTGIEYIYSKGPVRTYVRYGLSNNVWKPVGSANPAFGIKVIRK